MGRPKAGQYQDTFKRANQMWRANGSPPGRMKEYLERAGALNASIDNPEAGRASDQVSPNDCDQE